MLIYNRKWKNFAAIYKLTCLKNKRIYVGRTKDFGKRSRDHARYVNHPEFLGPWWAKEFAESCGATDFERDYMMEVLEYVDGLEGDELDNFLDEREIYWIEKLDATNPDIGFNTHKGGQGNAKPPKEKYRWHGYKSDLYVVFDLESGETELIYGLKNVDKEYGFTGGLAHNAHCTFNSVNHRWYVVDANVKERARLMDRYVKVAKNKIEQMRTTGDRHVSQLLQVLINKLEDYYRIEMAIYSTYPYEPCVDESTLIRIRQTQEELKRLRTDYILHARSYNKFENNDVKYAVAVYEISSKHIVYYDSLDAACNVLNFSKFNLHMKMRNAMPIAGKYYVYFLDDDLADKHLAEVRKNCSKSAKDRSRIYPYYCGYLKTRPGGTILQIMKN